MGGVTNDASRTFNVLPSDQDGSGRSFGETEIRYLTEVLESGRLFAPKGTFVKRLEENFARRLGLERVSASSSGSAAIHAAIAALDFEPGDEVITTPITDMGALSPILYQGLIPVFADVDPGNGLVTAGTIAERISSRTRAIVVTHLFGNPAEMGPILALANHHGLRVIEDCAQAFGATLNGKPVGSFGDVGCFSLQQGKHITSGEGGLTATSDLELAGGIRRYINKAWDYDAPTSDHDALALNYRMSELQGAVALAQLERLDSTVAARVQAASVLEDAISGIDGVFPTSISPMGRHSYWRFPLLVDLERVPGGPIALAGQLRALNIPSAPRYIQKPAFACGLFVNRKTLGSSQYPFTLARDEALDYRAELFPGTYRFLERVLVLPWNERFTPEIAVSIGEGLAVAVDHLREVAA